MAFGDALRADGASVRLTAETGEFNAKVEAAERQWNESVAGMSREALKLDLAQQRLKTSLAKYGAESAQAKRATIGLKDAEEAAARAADKQEDQTRQLTAAQNRQRLGIGGLTKGVLGLGAAYVGVHGLVSGIRSSIEAAKEQQVVMGQTRVALEAVGITWDQVAARVNRGAEAIAAVGGFDDEEVLRSFQTFARRTHDVALALRLTALAADVARGRYIDLEQAQNLVLKASLGQAGALRRVGIEAEKGAKASELLDSLQRSYAGAAEEYGRSAAGATDRFNKALEDTKEIIGTALLPAITGLLTEGTHWLDQANRSGKLQRQLNDALETGEDVVRGFAGALRITRAVVGPLVDDLGGLSRAIEIALVGGFVVKGAKALRALGLLRAAIWVLGPTATKSAVQVVAAEQAMGAGAMAANVRMGILLRTITRIGLAAFAVQAAVDALTPGKQGLDFSDPTGAAVNPVFRPGMGWVNPDTGSPVQNPRYWDKLVAGGYYDPSSGKREKPSKQEQKEAQERLRGQQQGAPKGLGAPPPTPKLPDYTVLDPSTPSSPGTRPPDVERAVERGAERGTERGARRANEGRDRERRQRVERIRPGRLPAGILRGDSGNEAAVRQVRNRARLGAQHDREPGLTEAEVRRMHFEFLSSLHGVVGEFGSNFQADGGGGSPQTWALVELTRDQNRRLSQLTSAIRGPGARYAGVELTALQWGVGF
jgi:hypothetical protein